MIMMLLLFIVTFDNILIPSIPTVPNMINIAPPKTALGISSATAPTLGINPRIINMKTNCNSIILKLHLWKNMLLMKTVSHSKCIWNYVHNCILYKGRPALRTGYTLLVINIIIVYMICDLCFRFTFSRNVYEI